MERGEAWGEAGWPFSKRHSEEKKSGVSTPGPKKRMWEQSTRIVLEFANFFLTESSFRKSTADGHPSDPPSSGTQAPSSVNDLVTLLRYAVTQGDYQQADKYISKLTQKNMLQSVGFTTQDAAGNGLLQIAALGGYPEIAKMLLDRGININSVDRNHGTALQAAIFRASTDPNEVIRLLLDWKPPGDIRDKINVNTKGGYYGCALQVAAYRANSKLVRELVNHCDPKAEVNISGGKFGFPLQAAVRTGRRAVVEPILSATTGPADVNAKGGKYGTALQAVARGKYRKREKLPEISRGQVLVPEESRSRDIHVDLDDNDSEEDYREVANMLFDKGVKMDSEIGILDNPINAGE